MDAPNSEKAIAQYRELADTFEAECLKVSARDGWVSVQAMIAAAGCILSIAFDRLPEDRRPGEMERFIKTLRGADIPQLN